MKANFVVASILAVAVCTSCNKTAQWYTIRDNDLRGMTSIKPARSDEEMSVVEQEEVAPDPLQEVPATGVELSYWPGSTERTDGDEFLTAGLMSFRSGSYDKSAQQFDACLEKIPLYLPVSYGLS